MGNAEELQAKMMDSANKVRDSVVWAQFAAAAMVGNLASEDIDGNGVYTGSDGTTRSQKIASDCANDADALLAEWKKRFSP